MTKFDKMRARDDLKFLITFKITKCTRDLWLSHMRQVFNRYWPTLNVPGYILATFFEVKKIKGNPCLVERQNGMTLRQKEMSAKGLLQQLKSQLDAEIGLM